MFSIYRKANQRNQNDFRGHRAPTLPNFILFTTYCFGAGILAHLEVYYHGKKLSLVVMTKKENQTKTYTQKKKAKVFCEICAKKPPMNQKTQLGQVVVYRND